MKVVITRIEVRKQQPAIYSKNNNRTHRHVCNTLSVEIHPRNDGGRVRLIDIKCTKNYKMNIYDIKAKKH